MDWLPKPVDFRGDLRSALALPDPEERFAQLAALARLRLGYLETIQLSRAVEASTAGARGFAAVKIAILSSSTVDHLMPAIRIAGLRKKLLLDVRVGQYGQYRQELLQASSPLRDFAPQIILLSLNARDLAGSVPLTATQGAADAAVESSVAALRDLWRQARESWNASVIQQTYFNFSEPLFGSYERAVPGSPAQLIARLNDRVATAAFADGTLLLDIARASERDGIDAWFDRVQWFQGKLEIAPRAAMQYGELLARVVGAQRGLSRKCLVLDLDNTLWGGIVGDDGVEGLVLGEGSAVGEAHLALQRYARQLKDRGVILAVCSKNDPAIAADAFSRHPEMHLRRDDIAAFVANWDPKPENLKLIAQRLNIGLDSLVFVDDNPAERAAVREALPMVAVPELPGDASLYVPCLAQAGYFETVAFTADDSRRGEQYAANLALEAERGASQNLEEFLRGLQMTATVSSISPVDLARVVQLINKTNQFNPTTRRYSADVVSRMASDPANLTLQFRLIDRFADNGLISAMILLAQAGEPGVFVIDTWVMSCRVFGRQLELEAMNIAVEGARRLGAHTLLADYIPTAKNVVVKDVYPNLGFETAEGAAPGATRWKLKLSAYKAQQTHIDRRSE